MLRLESPGTPAETPPTEVPFYGCSSPLGLLHEEMEKSSHALGLSTPPSVGELPFAGTPTVASPFPYNRLCSTPVQSPLVDPAFLSPSTVAHSPSSQSLRRSPRTSGKGPSGTKVSRRMVPIARKGGPAIGMRSTPSKRNSPSIVTAGKRASITSITVGQSTPKGKNCIPTEISSSDLRRAVDAILDDSSNDLLSSTGSSGELATRLSNDQLGRDIVVASGVARRHSNETHYDSDDTVGVAQALMELASTESPLKTPQKPSEQAVTQNLSPSAESYESSSKGVKRKASPSTKKKKKERRSPKRLLKNMNIQSMLDLIHK
ncbi:uncharacterized protein [Watersipora subatra]|uniref:uncharacterized protein n=1 Tax=Watersipora subatra TaxID=2589382 RepID=UPI00355B5BCE